MSVESTTHSARRARVLDRKLDEDLVAAHLRGVPADAPIVRPEDIADLPFPVRRYLRFMGVVGRPRDWSLRTVLSGKFRMRLDGGWFPAEAVQYNTRLDLARVFVMRLRMGGIVPVYAHDTYVHGHGRMLGKVLDRFTVADGQGEPFDIGELVTYLNDAILMAPSMVLGPETTFTQVDEQAFDVTMTDGARTVHARVLLDEHGRPRDFETTDRFREEDGKWVRCLWTTPVDEWTEVDGRPVIARARALWHPPSGAAAYADFRLQSIEWNVPPG